MLIVNGGSSFPERGANLDENVILAYLPGETAAYWKDSSFGISFGPKRANESRVKVSAGLVAEVQFFGFDRTVSFLGLGGESEAVMPSSQTAATAKLSAQLDAARPESDTASARLADEVSEAGVTTGMNYAEMTQGNSLERLWIYLSERNLVSPDELAKLKRLQSVEEMVASIRKGEIKVNFDEQSFIGILSELHLDTELVSRQVRSTRAETGMETESRLTGIASDSKTEDLAKVEERAAPETSVERQSLIQDNVNASPELLLRKRVDKTRAYFGTELVYELELVNTGAIAAREIVVIDCLPLGTRYLGVQRTSFRSDFIQKQSRNRQILVWRLAQPLSPGESGTISFKVEVIQ